MYTPVFYLGVDGGSREGYKILTYLTRIKRESKFEWQ